MEQQYQQIDVIKIVIFSFSALSFSIFKTFGRCSYILLPRFIILETRIIRHTHMHIQAHVYTLKIFVAQPFDNINSITLI